MIKKSVVSAEFSNLHINIDYDPKKTQVVSRLQQKYMAQSLVERMTGKINETGFCFFVMLKKNWFK